MNVVAAGRPALEKSAVRKIKRRLISFLALLMVVNFIDRTNVGFAAMLMAAMQNTTQFIALRVLLGVAEAGFYPAFSIRNRRGRGNWSNQFDWQPQWIRRTIPHRIGLSVDRLLQAGFSGHCSSRFFGWCGIRDADGQK